jgi:hypothetical protein
VPHLVLAEQQPDQLLRGRLVGHAQGLVLNVRPIDSVMKPLQGRNFGLIS